MKGLRLNGSTELMSPKKRLDPKGIDEPPEAALPRLFLVDARKAARGGGSPGAPSRDSRYKNLNNELEAEKNYRKLTCWTDIWISASHRVYVGICGHSIAVSF